MCVCNVELIIREYLVLVILYNQICIAALTRRHSHEAQAITESLKTKLETINRGNHREVWMMLIKINMVEYSWSMGFQASSRLV